MLGGYSALSACHGFSCPWLGRVDRQAAKATIATDIASATSSNTANTLVKRDGSGNFSASIITATLAGNASTATKLAATKNIYGNAFDGSVDLGQAIT